MIPFLLPEDLNAEELLAYLPEESFVLSLEGLHKRNTYRDVVSLERRPDGKLSVQVARRGLYDSLPEYLFHPINRFDDLPLQEEKERFAEECRKQEKEVDDARRFFRPSDMLLLDLRVKVKKRIEEYVVQNKALIDMLADDLTEEQRQNRFIVRALPFLPKCRDIRGDRTLLTLMLRKIFFEEGIVIGKRNMHCRFEDAVPRYESATGGALSDVYVGNAFDEYVSVYSVSYWSDDDCDERFLSFVAEIEAFGRFVQDYFMSVEELILFDVSHDEPALRISDDRIRNYLNHNANI